MSAAAAEPHGSAVATGIRPEKGWFKTMEKETYTTRTLEVTITLHKNGHAMVEFYDTESGDYYPLSEDDWSELANDERVGSEIGSWLELMADEV